VESGFAPGFRLEVLKPLGALGRALLDLVYPPRCAACGAPIRTEPFCPVCADAVDPLPPGCARCGLPGPGSLCGACLASPPAFDAVLAGGLFGGPLADAIHARGGHDARHNAPLHSDHRCRRNLYRKARPAAWCDWPIVQALILDLQAPNM